jgi:hypothetical protein
MRQSLLITLVFIFCGFGLHAQTVLNGRVFENKMRIALQGVTVEDLSSKQKVTTGDDGRFSITAKPGDLLVLKSFGYQTDTLLLTDLHEKEIFLDPQGTELKQVTVSDSSVKQIQAVKNMRYYDPQFHGQTMVYHRNLKKQFDGGIILRMHYFKGDEHKKKKELEKEQQLMLYDEISTIFTPDNISHYLPLKDADLNDFLLLYTPDVNIYNKKDFDLLQYLNTCYKTWLTLTPGQRKAGQIFNKQ